MPHSFGYRGKTRHLFARKFGERGTLPTQVYLKTYRIGQLVDIVANGAVHKGMPHKLYHGRTGRIWNVTPRAVGVEVNKLVRNRILKKRIHVRIEHVKPSKCRDDFLKRVISNEVAKKAAKESGKRAVLKRLPVQPRCGSFISKPRVETITALPFTGLYQ